MSLESKRDIVKLAFDAIFAMREKSQRWDKTLAEMTEGCHAFYSIYDKEIDVICRLIEEITGFTEKDEVGETWIGWWIYECQFSPCEDSPKTVTIDNVEYSCKTFDEFWEVLLVLDQKTQKGV